MRRLLCATLVACLAAACSSPARAKSSPKDLIRPTSRTASQQRRKAVWKTYWSQQQAEDIRRGAQRRRSLFPDVSYSLLELIAEGDRVVAIFRVKGTATNPGGSQSEGILDHNEVAIYTVRDERILHGEVIADLLAVTTAWGYQVVPGESLEP